MVRMMVTNRDDNPYTTSFGNQLLWNGINLREEFILPEQFFSPVRFHDKHRGEVALLYAILGDAIRCFLEGREKQRQDRGGAAREAETWLFVDDELWPFSFINICELLDLSPTALRLHLRRWQRSSDSRRSLPDLLPRFRRSCKPVRQLHEKG